MSRAEATPRPEKSENLTGQTDSGMGVAANGGYVKRGRDMRHIAWDRAAAVRGAKSQTVGQRDEGSPNRRTAVEFPILLRMDWRRAGLIRFISIRIGSCLGLLENWDRRISQISGSRVGLLARLKP